MYWWYIIYFLYNNIETIYIAIQLSYYLYYIACVKDNSKSCKDCFLFPLSFHSYKNVFYMYIMYEIENLSRHYFYYIIEYKYNFVYFLSFIFWKNMVMGLKRTQTHHHTHRGFLGRKQNFCLCVSVVIFI